MTRGKYAARAAQSRAESAGARADQAAEKLAAEQQRYAAEISELKEQVESLSAALTGAVADLADERVRQVELACADQIRTQQENHERASREIFQILGASMVNIAPDLWYVPGSALLEMTISMADALDVPAGDAWAIALQGKSLPANRKGRRLDANQMFKIMEDQRRPSQGPRTSR